MTSRIKIVLTTFLVIISHSLTFAKQPIKDDEVMLGLRTGHNATFGCFAAASIQTIQNFSDFNLQAGVQYNTIGKTAVEARPAYVKAFNWGKISAEALVAYTNLTSVNSISAGAGVGLSGKWIGGKLGYYYRMYGTSGSRIQEPFNIYYEIYANLLPMLDSWTLQLVITNNEVFELERHYQPTFIAQCRYDLKDSLGLSMGVGYKPSGMFHVSADYYQSFLNLGVYYRW